MSQSGSLPAEKIDSLDVMDSQSNGTDTPQWKHEVNRRLAAHRNRRGTPQEGAGSQVTENPRIANARASEAAARVAARYAKAPSYSQLLAGEARAVVRAAGAAAEAARNAQVAAQAVLAGLESGPVASGFWEPEERTLPLESCPAAVAAPALPPVSPRWQEEPPAVDSQPGQAGATRAPWAGAQPRWEEALPVTAPPPHHGRDVWAEMRVHPSPDPQNVYHQDSEKQRVRLQERDDIERDLFGEESFDSTDFHDPMGMATVEPVQHLPANLIEFPRELVAPRKARPRLAEGPFYDDSHHNSQLSIFEVDPELLAHPCSQSGRAAVAPPEWASIELDHPPTRPNSGVAEDRQAYLEPSYVSPAEIGASYAAVSEMSGSAVEEMPADSVSVAARNDEAVARWHRNPAPKAVADAVSAELLVARLSDRLLAAVVDTALVTLAYLAAAVVVIASTAHPPTGRIALIASGCGMFIFGLLYQFLFLSYAEEGTPGMRYARIALCTFDDDNPTVREMRMRIPALLLSALPAGLGLFWALCDKDHLGWHDRITKTYQRKY